MIGTLQPTESERKKRGKLFSRLTATILKNDRDWPVRIGLWRFIKIVLGWGAPTSQELAANSLMLVGFFIEGFILWQVVLAQAKNDIGPTSLPVLAFLRWLVACLIYFLLFHQFAIFRNFALPREAAHRASRTEFDHTIVEASRSLEQSDPRAHSAALAKLNRRFHWQEDPVTWRKRVEVVLYALFGVLTGEAGYMLTLLHERNENHVSAAFVAWLFGTQNKWGETLECVFLTCAMFICIGVLLWDVSVASSEKARKQYESLLKQFFVYDGLSLVFWACLWAVVTPNVRWQLGAQLDAANGGQPQLGLCGSVWVILIVFSALYIGVLLRRFWRGMVTLGKEPTYNDARFKEI